MPRARSVNPAIRSICRASSSTALAPAAKSTPACDALPRHHHGEIAHALARGLQLACQARAWLQHQHRLARARRSSRSARATTALPTSSSEFSCSSTFDRTGMSSSRSARTANRKNAIPAFMSSTPGPHKRPLPWRNGMLAQRAHRPDGVGVAQRQNLAPFFRRPGRCISHTRCLPNWPPGCVFTRANGAAVSATRSMNRSTAAAIVARRFALHEPPYGRRHFRLVRACKRENRIHGCYVTGLRPCLSIFRIRDGSQEQQGRKVQAHGGRAIDQQIPRVCVSGTQPEEVNAKRELPAETPAASTRRPHLSKRLPTRTRAAMRSKEGSSGTSRTPTFAPPVRRCP